MVIVSQLVHLAKENLPSVYDSEKWSQLVVSSKPTETSTTSDLIDYLCDAGIHVNLFQLIDYIKENEITKKVVRGVADSLATRHHLSVAWLHVQIPNEQRSTGRR